MFGRGTSAVAKSFTIDGRDMFIAVEVARLHRVVSRAAAARVRAGQATTLRIGSVVVTLSLPREPGKGTLDMQQAGSEQCMAIKLPANGGIASAALIVPVSDDRGGLYTTIKLATAAVLSNTDCTLAVRTALAGTRLERRSPKQPAEL